MGRAEALVSDHLPDFLRLLEQRERPAHYGLVDADPHGDLLLPELQSVPQVRECPSSLASTL